MELPRQRTNQLVFDPFHFPTRGRNEVVMPTQMQQGVDVVADNFGLPSGAKFTGLADGYLDADKNFPVQGAGHGLRMEIAIVEGDDVRWPGVVEVVFVNRGHFLRADEVKSQIRAVDVRKSG